MDMLTHKQIWAAIDELAESASMSASGLARNSGLDPTSFNPSKRFTSEGRERWPSTESIAKILKATGTSISDFMDMVETEHGSTDFPTGSYQQTAAQNSVPLIGFAQAGVGGFFDDGGFPVGQGWEEISPPTGASENAYALKVSGDSMMPLYREGDIIIVDPTAQVRKGDRVVAKTREGEVFAKTLERKTSKVIELLSLNPEHDTLKFAPDDLEWLARIIWASQ
jgi:phage repressor protein C with HTH and peptisase S24 domain